MTKPKIKPCPFCGSSKIEIRCYDHTYWCACLKCKTISDFYAKKHNAVKRWNTRITEKDIELQNHKELEKWPQ